MKALPLLPLLALTLVLQLFSSAHADSGTLPENDDDSSDEIAIGFTFRFFGEDYDTVYINNNGNLTFGGSLSEFTPDAFPSASGLPIIAPFWADVDTRNGKGTVSWQSDANTFKVTWSNVGYYDATADENTDARSSFSVTLQRNNGIVFDYVRMNWTTGDASDGTGGFGGAPATLGLDKGTGLESDAVVFRRYDSASVSELNGTRWYFQTDNASLERTTFKQFNGLWGNQLTLNGPTIVKNTGCFLSSSAMILKALGHNTDPGKLNGFLKPFMSGDSLSFPNFPSHDAQHQARIFYGQTDGVPGPPVRFRSGQFILIPPELGGASESEQLIPQITYLIEQYGPILLRVPSRNWGTHLYAVQNGKTHAVVADTNASGQVVIRDPGWSGTGEEILVDDYVDFVNNHLATHNHEDWQLPTDWSWFRTSETSLTYTYPDKLTPFKRRIIMGQVNSPVEIVIRDAMGRRLGHNPETDESFNEIPGAMFFRELPADDAEDENGVNDQPGRFGHIVFELEDAETNDLNFTVYGLARGHWSVQLGLSDPVFGYNPRQSVVSGTATRGSIQNFAVQDSAILAFPYFKNVRKDITNQLAIARHAPVRNPRLIRKLGAALKSAKRKPATLRSATKTFEQIVRTLNSTSLSNIFSTNIQAVLNTYIADFRTAEESLTNRLASAVPSARRDTALRNLAVLDTFVNAAEANADSRSASHQLFLAAKKLVVVRKLTVRAEKVKP
jgi:hypothetical protein